MSHHSKTQPLNEKKEVKSNENCPKIARFDKRPSCPPPSPSSTCHQRLATATEEALGSHIAPQPPSSSSPSSIEQMQSFHRAVMEEMRQRGDDVLRYRWPHPAMFAASMGAMLVVADLAFAAGLFARDFDTDVLMMRGGGPSTTTNATSLPLLPRPSFLSSLFSSSSARRWDAVKTLTGGVVDLTAIQRTLFGLFVSCSPNGTSAPCAVAALYIAATRARAAVAVALAARAPRYVHKGSSVGVAVMYGVGTFFGGASQIASFREEVARINRLNRDPDVFSSAASALDNKNINNSESIDEVSLFSSDDDAVTAVEGKKKKDHNSDGTTKRLCVVAEHTISNDDADDEIRTESAGATPSPSANNTPSDAFAPTAAPRSPPPPFSYAEQPSSVPPLPFVSHRHVSGQQPATLLA